MPRIRTIKPKFWDDVKLSKVSRDARLLFIGMWTYADDLGVIIGEHTWLKSKVFPYDEITLDEFQKWLYELLKFKFIRLVMYNDEQFFHITNFSRHQKINKPNNDEVCIPKQFLDQYFINHGTITEQSRNDSGRVQGGKGEESNSKGEERSDADSDFEKKIKTVILPFNGSFEKIWIEWKDYRHSQHDFKYKSAGSEQAALHELVSIAYGKEETAISIIKQSMAKGWKGFFPLKNSDNGQQQSKQPTGSQVSTTAAFNAIDKLYSKT